MTIRDEGFVFGKAAFVPSESPASGRVVALNPMDRVLSFFRDICIAFVFKKTLDEDKLQKSLAEVLQAFPMLTGCLSTEKDGPLLLEESNKGVSLVFASSTYTFEDVVPGATDGALFYPKDIDSIWGPTGKCAVGIDDSINNGSPLFQATACKLAGGGSLLAIRVTHSVADMTSLKLLMYGWAAVARGEATPAELNIKYGRQVFDEIAKAAAMKRDVLSTVRGDIPNSTLKHIPTEVLQSMPPPQNLPDVLCMHVSRQRLNQLKAEALKTLPEHSVQYISTNDALLARIWQVSSELSSLKGKDYPLCFACNLRPRIPSPSNPDSLAIPATQFGNWILPALTEPMNPKDHSLGELAAVIRQRILVEGEFASQEFAWLAEKERQGIAHEVLPIGGDFAGQFTFTNWDWDFTKLDFGSGTPSWFQNGMSPPINNAAAIVPSMDKSHDGMYLHFVMDHETAQEMKAMKFTV